MWKTENVTSRRARVMATACMLGAALTLTACADDAAQSSTDPTASARVDENAGDASDDMTYEQVEFLGNPLVSEVTIAKANHDRYNRTQPYNSAEFGPQSLAFINAFRGNQPIVANTLGAVLYPDMLIVQSARNPSTSGWLSWALADGWGGRNLSDDVVDAGLSAIFGTVITAEGKYCNNGELPLCTDNVSAKDEKFQGTFPYLGKPTL